MAKKMTPGRAPWTKEDVRALKAHSKSKTPAAEVAKALKRTEGAVRQKAKTIGIGLTTGRIRRKSPFHCAHLSWTPVHAVRRSRVRAFNWAMRTGPTENSPALAFRVSSRK